MLNFHSWIFLKNIFNGIDLPMNHSLSLFVVEVSQLYILIKYFLSLYFLTQLNKYMFFFCLIL